MGLKIFKVIWFFSLITILGVFMYVYASLPETVAINEGSKFMSVTRESLFYIILLILALTNTSVFAVNRILPKRDHDLKAWFYGLIACANLFFVVGLSFVTLLNSSEKFDYTQIGPIIYGSLILLIGWAASWPVYRIIQRIFNKQVV